MTSFGARAAPAPVTDMTSLLDSRRTCSFWFAAESWLSFAYLFLCSGCTHAESLKKGTPLRRTSAEKRFPA